MSPTIQRATAAGELTWWLNAVLAHTAPPDEALDRWGSMSVQVSADDPPISWAMALAPLRALGVRHLDVRFVEPGDPLGLPGPVEVTQAAVAEGVALVPQSGEITFVPVGGTDRWRGYPVGSRSALETPLGTLGEARGLMRTSMAELTAALPGLDPDDQALAEVARLRSYRGARPPAGVDPEAARIATDAMRVWWLTLIAGDLAARRDLPVPDGLSQLRPLARRAASVAFSQPISTVRVS